MMTNLGITMSIIQLSFLILSLNAQGYRAQLFPHGPTFGDTLLIKGDDGNSGELTISNNFTFFGVTYQNIFVNINGAVSFANALQSYTTEPFPLGDDRVIIAPLWTDIDTSIGLGHGDVMYRELLPTNQTVSVFRRANQIVRNAYGDQTEFSASWMFIATWSEVAQYNSMDLSSLVNSFQCILVTDGDFCGAIMVYDDINWPRDHGDEDSGYFSSSVDQGQAAQAGFNAGDNTHFYMIESSGTSDIIDIDTRSNIGQPGLWLFRVDGLDITDTACNTRGEQLTVYPKDVPMLGGSEVFISGPCFSASNHVIQCDFSGVIVNGNVSSTSIATCVTPTMFVSGSIDVRLSLDGGSTYPYIGTIFVGEEQLPPANLTSSSDGNLEVTWDPTELKGISEVEIMVYEFSMDSSNLFSWEPVYSISRRTSADRGRLEFNVRPESTRDHDSSPKIGAVGILELDGTNQSLGRRAIWSEIHSLNWLYPVNTTSWCSAWVTQELSELDEWLPQRPSCPCSERQARRDIGSFTSFLDCRISGTDQGCLTKRPGAMFCVNSNFPSISGAGQECCYNADGQLLELDAAGSGLAHRQHDQISSPFMFAGLGPVPTMSHYLADTMPYLQCCDDEQSDNLCDLYRSVRPSKNCDDYQPPQAASAFGDPHFITFDGLNYTFNGYGEFTLANINNDEFILQARSLPMEETPNATVFKAVAAKTNTSDVIHVESNQRRGMMVFFRREGRNYEELNIDMKKTWGLRGVKVRVESFGFSIVFDNGIALKLTTRDDAFNILITIPYDFKGKTQGMLGTWNDNTSDDLKRPDDVIIPADSSMETIFNEFGNSWRITEDESLFYYWPGYSQSSYTSDSYTPLMIQHISLLDHRISHVCGSDQLCAFDFLLTGSDVFAAQTMSAANLYRSTISDLTPVTCEPLSLPNGRMMKSTYASPGSLASIYCDPCFELQGPNNITCGSNGSWLHPYPSCIQLALKCETPVAPSNGHVMVGGCPIIYATFTCRGGYDLKGSSMIECMASGQWSNTLPICTNMDKGVNMNLQSVHAAAIGGGLAVLVLITCLIIALLVTRQRHLKRKRELKKRASKMWSTTTNPLYDANSCPP